MMKECVHRDYIDYTKILYLHGSRKPDCIGAAIITTPT